MKDPKFSTFVITYGLQNQTRRAHLPSAELQQHIQSLIKDCEEINRVSQEQKQRDRTLYNEKPQP